MNSCKQRSWSNFFKFRCFISPVVIQVLFYLSLLGLLIFSYQIAAMPSDEYSFMAAFNPFMFESQWLTALLYFVFGAIFARFVLEASIIIFRIAECVRTCCNQPSCKGKQDIE